MELNDKAYTLHIDIVPRRKGRLQKGCRAWNKGMSWEEQGVSEEVRKRKLAILRATHHKNGYSHEPTHTKPIIQMDEDGNRLHWYESSIVAAKKIGCSSRNIRSVCAGKRKHAGGYRWKWDERFI